MRLFFRAAVCALAMFGGLVATASAQYNVDFSDGGVSAPAPSNAYGAASGQIGVWNNFTTATVAAAPLLNIGGNNLGVTLSLTANGFMFDAATSNPNGVLTAPGSDDELFMDDVWDSPVAATITVGNLPAGQYSLYMYGGSPDSATTIMNFIVNGNSQFVGGQWSNPFSYQAGITHAVFAVNHAGGDLVINVPDVTGFESVNGFQITPVPEPMSAGLIALAMLGVARRRRS